MLCRALFCFGTNIFLYHYYYCLKDFAKSWLYFSHLSTCQTDHCNNRKLKRTRNKREGEIKERFVSGTIQPEIIQLWDILKLSWNWNFLKLKLKRSETSLKTVFSTTTLTQQQPQPQQPDWDLKQQQHKQKINVRLFWFLIVFKNDQQIWNLNVNGKRPRQVRSCIWPHLAYF